MAAPPTDAPVASFLTEDRLAIQSLARDFAMKEVLPVANELDPVAGEIPMELRAKMAELGFFGILIPEEYGGLGLGLSEYAIIVEELARAWMSVASLIARGQQFTAGFNAEQRERYLPAMARGDFLSAFALSEAEAGSDVANLSCRATPDGEGWRINGQKMWCTFADGSDYLQVFARTEAPDPAHRSRGVTCFLMPKQRGTLPQGVSGNPVRKIGYHGWKTWELSFDDAYAEEIVGELGRGFRIAMGDLDTARIHTAARAIGLARGALEDSIAYADSGSSSAGPSAPTRPYASRSPTWPPRSRRPVLSCTRSAPRSTRGRPEPVQASMVKLFASEMAERVTSEGLQIHGGAGYTTDFAIERYWRDARLTKIFEGTSEIQMKIISDSLLGRLAGRG